MAPTDQASPSEAGRAVSNSTRSILSSPQAERSMTVGILRFWRRSHTPPPRMRLERPFLRSS